MRKVHTYSLKLRKKLWNHPLFGLKEENSHSNLKYDLFHEGGKLGRCNATPNATPIKDLSVDSYDTI